MRLFDYGRYLAKIEKNAYFNTAKNAIQFARPRKNRKELNHDAITSYRIKVEDGLLDCLFCPSKDIQYVDVDIELKDGTTIRHKIPLFVYIEILEKHLVDDKGYVTSGCLLFMKLNEVKEVFIVPKEIGVFEKLPLISGNSAISLKDVDENHIYIDSIGKRYFFINKYEAPKLNISKQEEKYKDDDGNENKRKKVDVSMNGKEDIYVFVSAEKYHSCEYLYFREDTEFFYFSEVFPNDLKDLYDNRKNYLLNAMNQICFGKPDTYNYDEKTDTLTYTVDCEKYDSKNFINMFDDLYKHFYIECGKNLKECLQISGHWNVLFPDIQKISDLTDADIGNIYEVNRERDIKRFLYLGEFASFSFKDEGLSEKKVYSFEPKSSYKKVFINLFDVRYDDEYFRTFFLKKYCNVKSYSSEEKNFLLPKNSLFAVDEKSEEEISIAYKTRYCNGSLLDKDFIDDSEKQDILKKFALLLSNKERENFIGKLKKYNYDIHQNVKENKIEVARYVEVEETVRKLLSLPISTTDAGIEMITSATDNIDIVLNILENSSIIDLDKEEL